MKTKSMYAEEIMEIYSEKPNFGELKNKTHEVTLKNKGCNDKFTLELEVDKDNKINDAKFKGSGCVISTVSASLITEKIKGMDLNKAKNLSKDDVDKLLGVKILPTRVKCELLALEALRRIK